MYTGSKITMEPTAVDGAPERTAAVRRPGALAGCDGSHTADVDSVRHLQMQTPLSNERN